MNLVDHALKLASEGFWVFPLVPNMKIPILKMNFNLSATRNTQDIRRWWRENSFYNIGIATSKFRENEALVVVDVDVKDGKKGYDEIIKLELEGFDFPSTFEQKTTSGGAHIIYRHSRPLRQGKNVLAYGLDIRSGGGYIVGRGSIIDGKVYTNCKKPLVEAPDWLVQKLGVPREAELILIQGAKDINMANAIKRAIHYLDNEAIIAVEGDGGDQTTFQVAAQIKDFGVDSNTCRDLMLEYWNEKCRPMWEPNELAKKVENAYKYGIDPVGISNPELQFEKVTEEEKDEIPPSFFDTLNEKHAFILNGNDYQILWETTDQNGAFDLKFLKERAFHQMYSDIVTEKIVKDKIKLIQKTKIWANDPKLRRTYQGLCFQPGKTCDPRFYNLWKGFAVDPLSPDEKPTEDMELAVKDFLDHILLNACAGDEKLNKWLVGYFAHSVQRPWEKPLTALVFKGEKGVGKNAIIDRINEIFGRHAMTVSSPRYLTGQFNGHLQHRLWMTYDEAFWSGNKEAEGVLKTLITGKKHTIEVKGRETYEVENCLRLAILSNEKWVVPTTHDERRFAVFEFENHRKGDVKFFKNLNDRMDKDGLRYLLTYLLNFDISDFELSIAPKTEGLLDQKIKGLPPFDKFWYECLVDKKVICADFCEGWPKHITKMAIRSALQRFKKENGIPLRQLDSGEENKHFRKMCKSVVTDKVMWHEGASHRAYTFPDIDTCRKDFELHIGQEILWPD